MNVFFGGLVMAIGILITGTFGFCTVWLLRDGDISQFGVALIFGILPTTIGVNIVFSGYKMLKKRD